MINYFMKKYALSRNGAKNIIKASIYKALVDIVVMSVAAIIFMFLDESIIPILNGDAVEYKIWLYVIYTIIIIAVLTLVHDIAYRASFYSAYEESAEKRIDLAEKLRKLPLSFFSKKDLSDLTTTIMLDTATLEEAFSHFMPSFFGAIISIPIIMIGISIYNFEMAMATLWVIPIAVFLVLITKKIQKAYHVKNKKIYLDYNNEIEEYVENIKDIKSNNRQEYHINKAIKQFENYEKQILKSEIGIAIPINVANLILKLGMASSTLYGLYMLSNGKIDIIVYIAFIMLSTRIFEPILGAFMNIAAIFMTQVSIDRMKVLEEVKSQTGSKQFEPKGYDIEFKNVKFNYDDNTKVLDDLSFIAKQGEITALVGPSGSGKTTAMRLSARFWDIDDGIITIGGKDISKIDPEVLLKKISIVFQDVTLFNNTVLENIRLGKKDATDEEVLKVAKLANCDEFVSKMKDGYNTFIGENGYKLSGGERQRLSIARALLKDAPIILLDEATSSLDIKNESYVQDAISKLMKDKTVLVIAHRMRTVAGSDKIVVINKGTVEEEGTYKELISNNGLYKKMVDLQVQSSNWNII